MELFLMTRCYRCRGGGIGVCGFWVDGAGAGEVFGGG